MVALDPAGRLCGLQPSRVRPRLVIPGQRWAVQEQGREDWVLILGLPPNGLCGPEQDPDRPCASVSLSVKTMTVLTS